MASGDSLIIFRAQDNEPPVAAFATLDTRNAHLVLDFDGATDEEAVFTGIMPANYAGGGLTIKVHVSFTSATSGTANIECHLERITGLDIDADSFAAFQDVGVTANGTPGIEVVGSITFTDGAAMDSIVAGDLFRLKIRRDADGTNGTDDIVTDMELLGIEVTET
jgi:hypothetical protein